MNSLPSEILHNIFIKVSLEQRLKCTLVCRLWYSILRRRSLLYEIDIRSDEGFDDFIDMLQRMPGRGSQVEILKLDIGCNHKFDKRKLFFMLPNLRKFDSFHHLEHSVPVDFFRKPFEFTDPNSKLVTIRDSYNCELARQLLMFGSCSRLRQLHLDLSCIQQPREEIFIHLKNVPTVDILHLGCCDIGIEDLELIHNSLPVLKILFIHKMVLIAGELPRDIIPATSAKRILLYMDRVEDYPNYPDFYKYMAKKYTSLTQFSCQDQEIGRVDSSQVMEIYREGILPFYKNNGNCLNEFKAINIPIELDVFNTLDEFGLQITKFKLDDNDERPIFDQLARSNQSKYVKSIELKNTAIASPIVLQDFTSLTTISIDSEFLAYWDINLTDYLNALPSTVTSFTAGILSVDINELPSHSNNIESLSLSCSTLSPKLADIISQYFPKLKELSLRGLVSENINIDLPKNHFKEIDIVAFYGDHQSHGFSITDAESSHPRHYIQEPYEAFTTLVKRSEEFDNLISINIKYSSTDALVFYSIDIDEKIPFLLEHFSRKF